MQHNFQHWVGAGEAARAQFFGLLQSGLDALDQGLTVFNHRLELVAWNRTFFALLDFPESLARVGTPFADFMRHNARRGEYGPGPVEDLVAERVRAAQAFESHTTERTRPNGRVIAVRGEPLPGKGFITVYTDVTAQRRAERMLREQNELLEAKVQERTADLLRSAAAQQRTQALLAQAQKMEAIGQLTGGIAHDFNNLLTVVLGNLATLRDTLGGHPAAAEFLPPALDAAQRGVELVQRLLLFARQESQEAACIDVGATLHGLLPLLRRSLPENIRLQVQADGGPFIAPADGVALESALLNLALNARDAMPDGGTLSFALDVQDLAAEAARELELSPGPHLRLAARDTGVGMDAATAARAFEPFFTTKAFGRGSGLGLAMVFGFARRSQGAVRIASRPGEGTTVTLWLPRAAAAAQVAAVDAPSAPAASGKALVLLVEDDAQVRAVVRRQVTALGHPVIEAANGEDAAALLADVGEIGIVLSDVVMTGGMDGRELVRRARALRPALHCVLMTGYTHNAGGEAPGLRVLAKPFTAEALARALAP